MIVSFCINVAKNDNANNNKIIGAAIFFSKTGNPFYPRKSINFKA